MNKKLLKIIILIVIIVLAILIITKKMPKIALKINLPIEEQIKLTKIVSEHSKDEIGNDLNTIYDRYDIVEFGKYYQNESGNKKTNIEWYVLDKNDDYALLLSKYVLDTSKMSESEEECQWSETILRKWLNNEFYSIAFNQEEKEKIIECELENFNIPLSLHKKQEKTKDKIFILSFEELQIYFDDYSNYGSKKISTTATEYAFSKNELFNPNRKDKEEEKKEYAKALNIPISALSHKTTTYWTRTFKDNKCIVVNFTGKTTEKLNGRSNLKEPNGIRPAIFIKLNKIATRSTITYDMFKSNEYLKEPNTEYDLTKTPSELKLFNKGEKNVYYKQLIEKKMQPNILKNFIDVDELGNVRSETVDGMLQEIENLAYKNVVNALLKDNLDFSILPVTKNYINNHPNLLSELKNITGKYEVRNAGIVNTKFGECLVIEVKNISPKTGYSRGGYGIALHFDNDGNINDIEIIESKY